MIAMIEALIIRVCFIVIIICIIALIVYFFKRIKIIIIIIFIIFLNVHRWVDDINHVVVKSI